MTTTMHAAKLHSPESLSDAALVQRARQGESAAFREIMQLHNRRLYRVARGVLGDDAEAEDAVQDAYLAAFQHLQSFRAESTLATWLTRITINAALQRRRRKRPKETAINSESDNVVLHPALIASGNPESDMARVQVRALLERSIARLPDHLRVVFMMRDVEGLSIEETAGLLALKTATVKTRLHRARAALRDGLDREMAGALSESFMFDGARCNRLTARVLGKLQSLTEPRPPAPAS